MGSHSNNAPDINTSYPGHVYNFDPVTQTCEVQLAIENLFVGYANAYTLHPKQRLQGVPVRFIQGGGWSITHPVPDGTPCYVHFSQRGIDHWLHENKSEAGLVDGLPAPSFSQLFSHNAAVCTLGNQPIPQAIPNFQADFLEIRNKDRTQRMTFHNNGTVYVFAGNASLTMVKNGAVTINSATQITCKAPKITLDGDTTVTKSLTVQGGMDVSGGSGNTMSITGSLRFDGDLVQTGQYTLNGIVVNNHRHTNPEGGDVGPMKAG